MNLIQTSNQNHHQNIEIKNRKTIVEEFCTGLSKHEPYTAS